jgi:phosphoribosylaminoimidazole (AIR) synthetase
MFGKRNDPLFLLKYVKNTRQRNKQATFIETHPHEIIVGLAQATQIYALAILKGDTSIFPTVMEYELAKQKRLHPDLFIPGLKQQDETSS